MSHLQIPLYVGLADRKSRSDLRHLYIQNLQEDDHGNQYHQQDLLNRKLSQTLKLNFII